jgi:hypothetical protein
MFVCTLAGVRTPIECLLPLIQVTRFLEAEVKPALEPFKNVLGGTVELNV